MQALFINESLDHLAKVLRLVQNNVHPDKIPFEHDPLTHILKKALIGEFWEAKNEDKMPFCKKAIVRMFVNISPSKYDMPVTNRSLKFARQTGKAKIKLVDKTYQK